jgi:acryloyl-coenzyme A reductase
LVMVGNVDPGSVEFNPALAILKEIEILGSGHGSVSDLSDVIDLVAEGKIMPEIAAFASPKEVSRAHTMMEERSVAGRVILTEESMGQQ